MENKIKNEEKEAKDLAARIKEKLKKKEKLTSDESIFLMVNAKEILNEEESRIMQKKWGKFCKFIFDSCRNNENVRIRKR